MLEVAVQNFSTKLSDADLAAYVAAYQVQVDRDFAPTHGLVGVSLKVYPAQGVTIPSNDWLLGFFDNSDVAGALGYHDWTPGGKPLGKVFVETTLLDGGLVSVDGSHELLEMMCDPEISTVMQVDSSTCYAFEICDAPEDDQFSYDINGIQVSDFVFMNWFTGGPGPYDFKGHIQSAREILPGGYIGALTFTNGQWTQLANTAKRSRHQLPKRGCRFERRTRRRAEWQRSLI
ncbi:MAG TPA: hypothetical protein VKS22_01220 [Candidatus Binataceae bacterium]|nr:hypothetical protein [Candidatus Binataceae bacterium]